MTHHLLEKKLSKPKPELIRRTLAIGVVALMFQGSSSALTSAWAAGCVENPNFCVVSTGDESIVVEDQHTLRSAVASANAVGGAQTIGFADELFGITRTDGVITGSSADVINPVVITLQSTLEIRSDLTIKAPSLDESPQILKIARGTEIASGAPLIAVNPTVNGVPASEGATTQVTIENVIIDSNANPNSGSDPRSTPGVAIEVKSTTHPENPVELTPELVVKNSQIVNGVSESGGAAINTLGNVVVENSSLTDNTAITPNGGAATDGGAILAAGSVTVAGSTLNNNSATGNGGAISASSVVVTAAEVGATSQLIGNTAGGNGGAVSSSGALEINENYTEIRANVAGGNGGALSAGGTVTIGNEVSITDNHAGQIRDGAGRLPSDIGGNGGAISAGETVTVTNTTLAGNSAQGIVEGDGPATGSGGAIASDGAVIVQGSVLRYNWSSGVGGAIYGDTVTVESARSNHIISDHVVNSELSGNFAADDGGAIFAYGPVNVMAESSTDEYRTDISENQSNDLGGAIFSESSVTLNNVKINDNQSRNSGGGIYSWSEVSISNTLIRNNIAGAGGDIGEERQPSETGGSGGALYASETITVSNSSFQSNIALRGIYDSRGDGGAIFAESAIEVIDSSFKANQADNNGGAIFANGQISISNSEFSSISINNPDYNPVIDSLLPNPDYDPETVNLEKITNPDYNPRLTVANSLYNVSVPPFLPNPDYGLETDAMIPNPLCVGEYVDYDGQCFFMDQQRPWEEGGGPVRYPLLVAGRAIDERVEIPNPEYDDRPFLYPLLNPSAGLDWRQLIDNPNFGVTEFIDYCEFEGPCDNREQIELGNTSGNSGGAIYALNSVSIDSSTISQNLAYGYGGAIYVAYNSEVGPEDFPHLQINNSEISYNQSFNESGGAVYTNDANLTITGSIFDGNHAYYDGGAIQAANARVSIRTSSFENNSSSSDDGGALDFDGSEVRISETTFTGNIADDDGGSIQAWDSTLELRAVTMTQNSAGGDGGAVDLNVDSTITILDSLFANNSAEGDGGVIDDGTMKIARSTFQQNSAGDEGGALWIGDHGQSIVLNSIFRENAATHFGGAIYGPAWAMFNDFIGNTADEASAISLTGRLGTMLVGNILQAPTDFETNLCNISFWNSPDNLASDSSCLSALQYNGVGQAESEVSAIPVDFRDSLNVIGTEYTRDSRQGIDCPLISCSLEPEFVDFIRTGLETERQYEITYFCENYIEHCNQLDSLVNADNLLSTFNPITDFIDEFSYCSRNINNYYLECVTEVNLEIRRLRHSVPDRESEELIIMNLAEMTEGAGDFLRQNFGIDRAGIARPDSGFWSVGAIQSISEEIPVDDTPQNEPPVLENNSQNIQEVRQERRENTISAAERALLAAEDAKRAAELAAAKLAKKEAAAKRAAERKAKLSKVSQKIAATKARGAALKQKVEWITLMKNFVTK
jgi:predicted outer membrane repeat protein